MSNLPTKKLEYTDGIDWYNLATENYVNKLIKLPVEVATTLNLAATYANGTSGVGATLTNFGTQASLVIDGVTLAAGNRVLVKDQTAALQNGIYTVTNIGSSTTNWVLTRAIDYDSNYLINKGDIVVVTNGTINSYAAWMQNTSETTDIGIRNINFVTFSKTGIISVLGTLNQIDVNDVGPVAGVVQVLLADNPVIPGNKGITIPSGQTSQRPDILVAGTIRLNTSV